jgi:hypothetical protein
MAGLVDIAPKLAPLFGRHFCRRDTLTRTRGGVALRNRLRRRQSLRSRRPRQLLRLDARDRDRRQQGNKRKKDTILG